MRPTGWPLSGATSATFSISTASVTTATPVTITATGEAGSAIASISLQPLAVTALAISPTSVLGGASAQGVFTLNGEATGAVVTQASDFEGNEYLEDNETQRFRAFIACQRDDPLAALSTVLNRTADYLGNHLRGRTVTLRVDERGVFHLTPAAA